MAGPTSSGKTHTGNVRAGNEDTYLADDSLGLWLVADGMGGHEAGEVASAIASLVVAEKIRDGKSLSDAIQEAHQAILEGARNGDGAHGMGSTIVAIHHVHPGQWELGWVGDSRAYLWKPSGELQQISKDHSYVQALIDSGAITEAEAEIHPDKNVITQCLGSLELSSVRVDTIRQLWQPGQKILMCSDGLTDEVSDLEIANILAENPNSQTAIDKLIETALHHGGKDNVTAVLVDAPPVRNKKRIDIIVGLILSLVAIATVVGVAYSLFWKK